jgi:hypothetical protein
MQLLASAVASACKGNERTNAQFRSALEFRAGAGFINERSFTALFLQVLLPHAPKFQGTPSRQSSFRWRNRRDQS